MLDMFFYLLERLTFTVFQLSFFIVASRILNLDLFAELVLLLAVMSIAVPLSFLGSDRLLLRDVASSGQLRSDEIQFALGSRSVGAAIALIVVILWWAWGLSITSVYILLIVSLKYIAHALTVFDTILVSQRFFRVVCLLRIGTVAGASLGLALVLFSSWRDEVALYQILTFYVSESVVFSLVALYIVKKTLRDRILPAPKDGRYVNRTRLVEVLFVTVAALVVQLTLRVSQLLFPYLSSPTELTVYAVGLRFAEASFILSSVVNNVLVANRSLTGGMFEPNDLGRDALRLMLTFGYLSGIVLFLAGPSLISLFFSPEFSAAAVVVQVLAFGIPGAFLGGGMVAVCAAEGRSEVSFRVAITTMILAILVGAPSIAWRGAYGGALAMAFTYWIPVLLFIRAVKANKASKETDFLLLMPIVSPKKIWRLMGH